MKDHLEGSLRVFGNYRLMIDSMAPTIISVVKTVDAVSKLNTVFVIKIIERFLILCVDALRDI